ncbi:MAG: hypothetical protein B6D55_00585 [Candidatus Omnitrophica bacterium 4484_70.2]|nr:MAG: hypothetical protein B6D55_00585 [Candidatus Omnitrophica bacterium 4484_70.2]
MRKTFSVVSLGCFRNLYDSQIIAEEYIKKGFKLKKEIDNLDILIINTCGFIKEAKEESITAIKEAIELKEKGKIKKISVRGCLVTRYLRQLEYYFPQIDEWRKVLPLSDRRFPVSRFFSPSHIAFLKICDGCSHRCSFCAIPSIKGRLKSRDWRAILEEVEFLDKAGVRELNIIGQNITDWGKDLYADKDLTFLLRKILNSLKNISWVRLLYLHPRDISPSLINLIAKEEKICKYIDLPIQHINDRILKLMRRNVRKKDISRLIAEIREKIPNVALRTSVIVGFPSEGEDEFGELLEFIKEVKFEKLGVFMYSREENTSAYHIQPQIHYQIKKRRYRQIMQTQKEISYQLNKRLVGKKMDVIVDERENDLYIGRTQFDCYEIDGIVYIKKKNLKVGRIYKVRIVDAYEYDLVGE